MTDGQRTWLFLNVWVRALSPDRIPGCRGPAEARTHMNLIFPSTLLNRMRKAFRDRFNFGIQVYKLRTLSAAIRVFTISLIVLIWPTATLSVNP